MTIYYDELKNLLATRLIKPEVIFRNSDMAYVWEFPTGVVVETTSNGVIGTIFQIHPQNDGTIVREAESLDKYGVKRYFAERLVSSTVRNTHINGQAFHYEGKMYYQVATLGADMFNNLCARITSTEG